MRYLLAESTRHLIWRIRTLAPIIGVVFVFGSTPVFARGGGHGGGHSGGHSGHSGGHGGLHHGGHVGDRLGGITGGSTARGHFTNQNPCAPTDKISEDCSRLGEKQSQTIQAEKAEDRVEWHSR
jgi:hypothetical protein